MVFVKWFFFFRDPEVLLRRFADCFVGLSILVTKKSSPLIWGQLQK